MSPRLSVYNEVDVSGRNAVVGGYLGAVFSGSVPRPDLPDRRLVQFGVTVRLTDWLFVDSTALAIHVGRIVLLRPQK